MLPILPFDVLLKILEESGKNPKPDFQLLRAFASTCRTLRPYALKHTYRDLRLLVNGPFGLSHWEIYDVKWQSMEKIVAADQFIASYVKEVRFLKWTGDIPPGLLTLLGQFKNLYRIDYGHSMNPMYRRENPSPEWSKFPESMRQGWRTVFQIPFHLGLRNLRGIPVSELQKCKRLTWISFDANSSVAAAEHFTPHHAIALEGLRSEAPFEFVAPMFLIADQTEITSLDFGKVREAWTDEDCKRLKGFPNLKRLQVYLKLSAPSFFHHLAPNVVHNLERFTMHVCLDDSMRSGIFASTLISGALHPGFSSLKVFHLEIHLKVIGLKGESLQEFDRLDELFASEDVFPVLEKLELTLEFGSYWPALCGWTNKDTTLRMPLTVARLMQRFKPTIRTDSIH